MDLSKTHRYARHVGRPLSERRLQINRRKVWPSVMPDRFGIVPEPASSGYATVARAAIPDVLGSSVPQIDPALFEAIVSGWKRRSVVRVRLPSMKHACAIQGKRGERTVRAAVRRALGDDVEIR